MFLDRPNMNFEELNIMNNEVDKEALIHLSTMVTVTCIEIFFQRTIVSLENCPQSVHSFQGYQGIDTENSEAKVLVV